ncbi:MAG: hypothetical protein PHS35_01320 [Dehalococcoidales bacterium]|nr:hypothetical protein [Dehalococcoidales bacterium]MDD5605455.1 hypothetical protein [Dehalococcoidales bacterium]MDX9986676.1 hypothetical protein [Dehalococcoidales bacterium]
MPYWLFSQSDVRKHYLKAGMSGQLVRNFHQFINTGKPVLAQGRM